MIVLLFMLCISIQTLCFFWVPNRYTASYWSGSPYIANRCISSLDLYIDRGATSNDLAQFNSTENIVAGYQALSKGFFVEATIPMTSVTFQSKHEPLINQKGGFCYQNSTVLGGWGINYDAIRYLDFIDFMVRSGVMLPAHTPLNPLLNHESVFGYQNWGIPVSVDIAFGLCEWMLFGFHTSACYIHHNSTIWHIQPYFKADHVIRGFSFWIGYSYTCSDHNTCPIFLFNNDTPWSMHTMHYGIDFEFIQSEFPIHPRAGFYYNHCIGGSNILKQSRGGMNIGLDIIW